MRAAIYDAAIVHLTSGWYREVLQRLPAGCRILDVGIGTGAALLANADLLVGNDLHVTGVDIDAAYVERCRRTVTCGGLTERIEARLESVYDHHGGPYDAAYFSASFMLLPEPAAALRHVQSLLRGEPRVYFTQTFERERSAWIETLKPLLRHVTTIDFGRVTYEDEFRHALRGGGMEIEEMTMLDEGRRRASVLVVARGVAACD